MPVALTLLVVAAIYLFSPNFRFGDRLDGSPYAGDFLQEWLGGYIVRAGDHRRFYDIRYAQQLQHDPRLVGFRFSEDSYLPIVYPPFYYVLISPLSRLPFQTAAWVWGGLMVGCFAATAVLLRPATCRRWIAPPARDATALLPWALPAAALFVPLVESLSSSQKGTVCLLIVTATYLLLDRKRPFCAGLVFGLLAFKPQLTLVIAVAMLLKRQWPFIIGGVVTGLVLAGLSLSLGTGVCAAYVKFSTGAAGYVQTAGYDLHKSHCLYGFFTLLLGPLSMTATRGATLLAAAGTIGLVARLLKGPLDPAAPHFAAQFSGLVIATVLLSPHLLTYDLTLLLLPMFLLTVQLLPGNVNPPARRRTLIWLLVLLYAAPSLSTTIAQHAHIQLTVPLMAALLFLLVRPAPAAIAPSAGSPVAATQPA